MNSGSVTHWIEQIKEGGESVAERELWDRYFSRLADLARTKLDNLPPHLRDDADLALSALNTFFTRAKQDCFSQLKLEDSTNREIADKLGRVERTVERKLDRIRQTWLKGAGVS